jgi:hypothetical protein
VSAADAGKAFDLRCRVREQMLAFVARDYPQSLPQVRSVTMDGDARPQATTAAAEGASAA